MRDIKWFGLLAASVVVLIGIATGFSSVEVRYQCQVEIVRAQSEPTEASVKFRVAKYRWWMQLWSGSDGSLWIESPQEIVQHYPNLRVEEEYSGLHWHILNGQGKKHGEFSTSDGSFGIETPLGLFAGRCRKVDA
jgi:hypothetical protein